MSQDTTPDTACPCEDRFSSSCDCCDCWTTNVWDAIESLAFYATVCVLCFTCVHR